jgi:erythromycin esterase-like protein
MRHLIERHGFCMVAVEADWPGAAGIDRHMRHHTHEPSPKEAFLRFPAWMWCNVEAHDFVEWLRKRRLMMVGWAFVKANSHGHAAEFQELVPPVSSEGGREANTRSVWSRFSDNLYKRQKLPKIIYSRYPTYSV